MAFTRSSGKPKQSRTENSPTRTPPKKKPTSKTATKASAKTTTQKPTSSKRKTPASKAEPQTAAKRSKSDASTASKQAKVKKEDISPLEKPVIINRSPVLQLWSACVASKSPLHTQLSWQACLNIGSAIATLCAVSKGKAIGMIEPPERTTEEQKDRKDAKEAAESGSQHIQVMGFKLPMKDDSVILSGKPVDVKEANLVAKFGDEQIYNRVKGKMQEAALAWEGSWDDFDKQAFSMYEKFRPNVPKGEKGWGRKGELQIADIEKAVTGE